VGYQLLLSHHHPEENPLLLIFTLLRKPTIARAEISWAKTVVFPFSFFFLFVWKTDICISRATPRRDISASRPEDLQIEGPRSLSSLYIKNGYCTYSLPSLFFFGLSHCKTITAPPENPLEQPHSM